MLLTPFITPIWTFKIDGDFQQEIGAAFSLESSQKASNISNRGGYQSEPIDLWKYFPSLLNQLNHPLQEVATDSSIKFEIVAGWVNINRNAHYNTPHAHPDCTFSGVFYLQCCETSGRIVFRNPTPSSHYPIDDTVPFFYGNCIITPEPGTFLVFPSYLDHYVEPNLSENARISIAINFRQIA